MSGALVASRKGLDMIGFMWLAVITGIGGGTLRDMILDVPVCSRAGALCLTTRGSRLHATGIRNSKGRWHQ